MDRKNLEESKTALINATENLIMHGKDPSKITTRQITGEAGVSPAMVNYCFGSKEALIYEVFNKLLECAKTHNPKLREHMGKKIDNVEELQELYFETIRLMLQYRGMLKAIIRYFLEDLDISLSSETIDFIGRYYKGKKTEGECILLAYQLSSINELMVLRAEDISEKCGINLMDDDVLRKVIKDNIESVLRVN